MWPLHCSENIRTVKSMHLFEIGVREIYMYSPSHEPNNFIVCLKSKSELAFIDIIVQ